MVGEVVGGSLYMYGKGEVAASPRSDSVGRQLIYALQHPLVLHLSVEIGLEIPQTKDVVEALVAASEIRENE